MENQRSSLKFLPPGAVVHVCCYCSESYEAEVAQGTSLIQNYLVFSLPFARYIYCVSMPFILGFIITFSILIFNYFDLK